MSTQTEVSADVEVENHGSLFSFFPKTDAARQWVDEHVQLEPYQWMGPVFLVEHRYAYDLAEGMREDGLVVV